MEEHLGSNLSRLGAERAASRSIVYGALSAAFRRPREAHRQVLSVVNKVIPTLNFPHWESLEPAFDAVLDKLGSSGMFLILEVEYNRLFVGPNPPRVYPYESMYQGPGGAAMGEAALHVLSTYALEGLCPGDVEKDLPDHVALELEFLAYLCAREAAALEERNEEKIFHYVGRQRDFIKNHLARWVSMFCREILRETQEDFFKCWANLLERFIRWEAKRLEVQVHGESLA